MTAASFQFTNSELDALKRLLEQAAEPVQADILQLKYEDLEHKRPLLQAARASLAAAAEQLETFQDPHDVLRCLTKGARAGEVPGMTPLPDVQLDFGVSELALEKVLEAREICRHALRRHDIKRAIRAFENGAAEALPDGEKGDPTNWDKVQKALARLREADKQNAMHQIAPMKVSIVSARRISDELTRVWTGGTTLPKLFEEAREACDSATSW